MGHGGRATLQQGAAGQGRLEHLHYQPHQFQQHLRAGADRHPSGPNAWFGWPNAPKLEALREAWLEAKDEEEQKRIVRDMQLQAWQDVPYVPLGLIMGPTAFSKTLTDIQMGWPVFHAVRRV